MNRRHSEMLNRIRLGCDLRLRDFSMAHRLVAGRGQPRSPAPPTGSTVTNWPQWLYEQSSEVKSGFLIRLAWTYVIDFEG